MGMRTVTWRVLAAVAVVVLGLSGCGGGGDDGEEAAEPDRTTTTVRDVEADLAAARAGLLRLSDLPAGWVEDDAEATDEEGDDDGLTQQLAECLDVDPALLATPDNPTSAESPDFSEPESGASVSNSVAFTASEAKAREVIDIFGRQELPSCLSTIMTRLLGEELPAGMTFGTVDVKRLAIDSEADETMAIRVQIPIEAESTTIEQYLDMVLARVGRAGITLTFSNIDSPVPADFEETALGIVVSRLRGDEPETGGDDEEQSTAPASSEFGPMPVETGGEQAALAAAATDEGRRWAAGGGPQGTTTASGEPFLGGYVVHLTDGATSYQVRVLGGVAVPFFGPAGDLAIVGPFSPGMHPTAEPETQAQADAITAAVIALGDKAESIETGGIELYAVYFDPPDDDSAYFHVDVYAEASLAGTFAIGGTEVR